jgi:hypothetical protein
MIGEAGTPAGAGSIAKPRPYEAPRRKASRAWMTKYHLVYRPLAMALPRRISAMIRVKNEAEYLTPSVDSIAPLVDEIILVDNLSTDDSPRLIGALVQHYPGKAVAFRYEHEVRRVGAESRLLAERAGEGGSPCLSANYYNWCLRRCSGPFVLKWDGDMIATDAFATALQTWRRSRKPVLVFHGANVHPGMQHLLAARITDKAVLNAALASPGIPDWAASLESDYPEPRLFPRFFARYEMSMGWTQTLASPWLGPAVRQRCALIYPEPCYLHMKFCKREPLANYSDDLAAVIAGNMIRGRELRPEWRAVLRRWFPPEERRP